MIELLNYYKKSDFVKYEDSYLVIDKTSCHQITPQVLEIIEFLPTKGTRGSFEEKLSEKYPNNAKQVLAHLMNCEFVILKPSLCKSIQRFFKNPKVQLIRGKWLNKLFGKVNSQIFNPVIVSLSVLFMFVVLFWGIFFSDLGGQSWTWLTYLCLIWGVVFHELGHSLAASYVGIGYRPIGLTWYLIWPIAYTNVSGISLLEKKKRFLINIGGIYFQSIALFFLCILYFVSKNNSVLTAIKLLNFIVILNLNPFIMSDCYWTIHDGYLEEAVLKGRNILYYIYQAGYFLFTVYIIYKIGRRLYSFVVYHWQGLFDMSFSTAVLLMIALYIQFLMFKGLSLRLIQFFKSK